MNVIKKTAGKIAASMNFTTGAMLCILIFPKVEKKAGRKFQKIEMFYDSENGKTITKFTDEAGKEYLGENEVSFSELTSGAIGKSVLSHSYKLFPTWKKVGAVMEKESKILTLSFYDEKNNHLGLQKM